jgi:hypothetical protein
VFGDKQIHDFIEAWRKDFGETLSFDAAKLEATRLVEFFIEMENALLAQRALTTESEKIVPPPSSADRTVKDVWRKMMRHQ